MSGKRPSRVRAAPARLEDEQAAAFELAELAAAYRNPAASAEVESSSSDESDDESGPEEEEERKASDVRPAAFPWTTVHAPVDALTFLPPRGPRDPPRRCTTPLDFFHLLLPESFLESMVDMTTNMQRGSARATRKTKPLKQQQPQQPNRTPLPGRPQLWQSSMRCWDV
jgi:hypothetical protein